MQIKLVLENGKEFIGASVGVRKDVFGDLIFNTSLTGYQEVLTDPSYHQEMVVMTFPVQGIHGVNDTDEESLNSNPSAFIANEIEDDYFNNHAAMSLREYLTKKNVQGIEGIDTRELTLMIRDNGSLKGGIVSIDTPTEEVVAKLKSMKFSGHVPTVSTKEIKILNKGSEDKVVFMDFGTKTSIPQNIVDRGYEVVIVPYDTTAEKILSFEPNYVFLSNGPGDPSELEHVVDEIEKLIAKDTKMCGICLGHQLIAIASGAKTFRMKFGQHSTNHPVQDIETKKVYITSQNHNYAVERETLPKGLVPFLKSLHDGTIAGIKYKDKPMMTVQFHPEASPGPSDANEIFDRFFNYLEGDANA